MTSLTFSPDHFPNLKGKVAIITGGAAGIGLATTKLFTSQGAKVVIADLRKPTTAVPSSIFAKCDVTVWADLLAVFDTAVQEFGHVDILVANAGVGEIEDMFLDEFDDAGKLKEPRYAVLEVNLKGVLNSVKIAVSYFRKTGRSGRIVLTSSTAGYMGEMGLPVYSAAKHGIIGLMRATWKNAAEFNIAINCVAPWMTETNLLYPELRESLTAAQIPIQKAESVAAALAHSASAKSWAGKTVFVSDNTFTELEGSIHELEPQWLGVENARLWNLGWTTRYFTSKSGL